MEAFLSEKFGFKSTASKEFRARFIVYAFAFAVIWSLGATIEEKHHEAMNRYIRETFQSILFPNVDLVYAYFLDISQTDLQFKHWNDRTP